MQALSPRGLDVAFNSKVLQTAAHLARCVDYRAPLQAVSGVQVENERVGMIDVLDARAPGVNFQHIGLYEIDQAAEGHG